MPYTVLCASVLRCVSLADNVGNEQQEAASVCIQLMNVSVLQVLPKSPAMQCNSFSMLHDSSKQAAGVKSLLIGVKCALGHAKHDSS